MALVKRNESDDKSLMLRYGRRRHMRKLALIAAAAASLTAVPAWAGSPLGSQPETTLAQLDLCVGPGCRDRDRAISVASIATTVMIAISGFAGKREVAAT
jgi:hypothetical protein